MLCCTRLSVAPAYHVRYWYLLTRWLRETARLSVDYQCSQIPFSNETRCMLHYQVQSCIELEET
jgi:hypothetical protein